MATRLSPLGSCIATSESMHPDGSRPPTRLTSEHSVASPAMVNTRREGKRTAESPMLLEAGFQRISSSTGIGSEFVLK
jgi:hypothetical protein